MDLFNIKTIIQSTKWWPILTVIKIYIILYIVCKLKKFIIGRAESHGILPTFTIAEIRNQILYPYYLFFQYLKSCPECPAMCGFMQKFIAFCRVYGKDGLWGTHLLFKPVVILFKADAVEAIMSNAEEIEKCDEYKVLRPLMGDGLLTSQGTKWRKHRKLLTPAFHFSILENCIPVFQEQANVLISIIKSRIKEPWLDILHMSNLCSMEIICQTAMGVSMNIQNGNHSDYADALLEIQETMMYRLLRPWLSNDIIFNLTAVGKKFNSNIRFICEFHEKVMKQKMDEMTKADSISTFDNNSNRSIIGKKSRKPFIELLLEHHLRDSSLTESDVRNEVNTFMSAGHDTVSKAISWVLYCLGTYEEVQRKVLEELDTLFENVENENISREVLSKMKYLECVIKETFRVYPVVPLIAKKCNQTFKFSNQMVRKGTLCIILIWELHRDSVVFPDPEKFIPERFLPENCIGRNSYSYIPFSAEPRNCIGQKFAIMEMKTVIASVLRHFRVKSLDPRDKLLLYPNITIGSVHPLRLRFESR